MNRSSAGAVSPLQPGYEEAAAAEAAARAQSGAHKRAREAKYRCLAEESDLSAYIAAEADGAP